MKTLTRIKGMKFISLLMALAMVFVLVGCGSSGNTQQAVSQRTNGEITAAAPEEGDSATAKYQHEVEKPLFHGISSMCTYAFAPYLHLINKAYL